MIAVIDSSIVIKWFVDEPDAALALDLRFHPLAAPDLLLAECANVMWKKVRRDEYDGDDAAAVVRAIEHANIALSPALGLTGRAFDIARTLGHAAYDCFYLALAERLVLPFVTADQQLVRKVAASTATSAKTLHLTEWSVVLNAK